MAHSVHPKIVNIIAKIYTADRTDLCINGDEQTTIGIKNGIKQGCNGSTLLFSFITYEIIDFRIIILAL